MRKCFLIIILIAITHSPALSQSTRDEKIDSLKKRILTLKREEKVDCLNLLANEEGFGYPSWEQRADSAYFYAAKAYAEAKKIDYKKGTAAALINLATSEHLRGVHFRINKKDDAETVAGMEKYLSEAIPLAEQLQDYEMLGYANELWGDMVYIKSKFKDHDALAAYNKKTIDYFHKAGNDHKEGEECLYQGERYQLRGYYEEALNYLQPALELNKKALSKAQMVEEKEYCIYLYNQSLIDMSNLYQFAGDYQTALEYLNVSQRFYDSLKLPWEFGNVKIEIFNSLGQFDSSFHYINLYRQKLSDVEDPSAFQLPWVYQLIGATFLKANEPDSALFFLNKSVSYFKKRTSGMGNYNRELPEDLFLNMAEAYAAKHEFKKALPYATEGLDKAAEREKRPNIMRGYELLSMIHRNLGNNDSAYQYLLKYITLKDSIDDKQFMFRLNSLKKTAEDSKKESRIGFLNRDNQIKQQQLRQEATFRNFLVAAFLAFVFAGLYVFRNINAKRKNERLTQEKKEQEWKLKELASENKHIELQKQSAELEMQALRAQMNPHFIFNSLNSINYFILKNEGKIASNYLTRFSRLIRMVLINSQKSLIPLQDELEMLRIYLDMERLRFKNSFDYFIVFKNEIDAEAVAVPPLILQPFCENALWHGLMHKDGQGHLTIDLSMSNNILECIISDDGVGRERAEEIKGKSMEKKKSIGLQITTQRLALLNQNENVQTFYTIDDVLDEDKNVAGTKVILKISHQNLKEEFA